MRSIIFTISFLFRKGGQMRRVNNFSRNTSVGDSACFTKQVFRILPSKRAMERAIEREREREKTRSIVVHHVLLASSEFHVGARIGNPLYRGTVLRVPCGVHAPLFRRGGVIEIQRWSGKYTLAASARKQMVYISDVRKEKK